MLGHLQTVTRIGVNPSLECHKLNAYPFSTLYLLTSVTLIAARNTLSALVINQFSI